MYLKKYKSKYAFDLISLSEPTSNHAWEINYQSRSSFHDSKIKDIY